MIAQNTMNSTQAAPQAMDGSANPNAATTTTPKPTTQQPAAQPAAQPSPSTLPPPQPVPGLPVPAASAPSIVPPSQAPVSQPVTPGSSISSDGRNVYGMVSQSGSDLYANGNDMHAAGLPNGAMGTSFAMTGSPSPAPATAYTGGVPGATMGQINPAQDLRSQTITPGSDPRLTGTQQNVSTLANTLTNGPNRFDIAKSNFDAFAKASEPQYQQDIRSATDAAAANGRLGSGMLSNNYETLAEARARALDTQRTSLLNNALEGTIGDTRANLGLMSGLEGQQFGEGQANRNELRGERGYENDMSQQALQNRVQEAQLEDSLTNSAFARGADATQLGFSGNPSSAELMASQQQGDQANQSFSDIGSLLRMMALSSALGGSGSPGAAPGGYGTPTDQGNSGVQITPQMIQQFMSMYQNGGGAH